MKAESSPNRGRQAPKPKFLKAPRPSSASGTGEKNSRAKGAGELGFKARVGAPQTPRCP